MADRDKLEPGVIRHPNVTKEVRVEVTGRQVALVFVTSSPAAANALGDTLLEQLKTGSLEFKMHGAGPATGVETTELCEECPPAGFPTDATRCKACPRRGGALMGSLGKRYRGGGLEYPPEVPKGHSRCGACGKALAGRPQLAQHYRDKHGRPATAADFKPVRNTARLDREPSLADELVDAMLDHAMGRRVPAHLMAMFPDHFEDR